MKGFNFSSIRARLMLLVLIAILPALGLTLYTATEHRHQAAAEAQQEALRLVRLASQDQEEVISRTRQLLAVMVQIPEVRSGNSAACNSLFSRVIEHYPLYAGFGLINTDGSLSCSFPQANKPVKLGDRQYFQTALKTKDFAIGDYSINRVTGKPSLQLAYPVFDEEGHVKSVLFVSVNLTWLNQLASKAELPDGASVTIIDRNGTILSRHPDPEKWVGKTMPEAAIIRTVLGVKSEGTVKSTGVDGVPKLYAYKPLNGPDKEANLYIYSGFPEKVVLADANRMLARNLAAMGMEAVTVLLLAWVGGKIFFLRRIQDLLESTRRLARGELQARTDLRYDKGELGQLSRSFDEMAGILALRESQLNETNAKYRSLVENSTRKLGQNLNLERLAEDVCRTCVEKYEVKLARLATAESDGSVRLLEQHPPDTEFPAAGINIRWDDTSPGQGPTGRAIRSESPVIINDLAGEPAGEPWVREMLAKGYLSLAALPLVSRDKVFGVLNLYNDKPGFFNPARIEFFQAYVHQAAAALENARLYSEAQQRYERLGALRNIDLAITGSLDLRVTFNVILDQVTSQLGIDAAAILLLNPYTQLLEFAAGRGFHTSGIKHTVRRMGEGNPGFAALERQTIHISNLSEARETFTRYTLLEKENFIAYYGVPLVAKGLVKGVLEIFHRAPLNPNREWLEFLNTLAGQAAIAIDNAALFSDLQRSNIKLTLAYDATIEGWSRALDLRDKETEGHSRRVTDRTVALAQAMGMSEADLVHIRRGALLHDIGKMGVPDHILLKPGPLTDEEWRIMRRHPVYAYEMLSPIAYLLPAMDIPYCHHEKWDGTGYPRGLTGEQIPLPARIFSLVDVWDALCSDRPYRKAWSREKARDYISSLAGTHFDNTIVELFLKME